MESAKITLAKGKGKISDSKQALQYISLSEPTPTIDHSGVAPMRDDYDITTTISIAFNNLRVLYPHFH